MAHPNQKIDLALLEELRTLKRRYHLSYGQLARYCFSEYGIEISVKRIWDKFQ